MPIIQNTPPISRTPPISTQLYTPTQAAIGYTLHLWNELGQPEDPSMLKEELEKRGVPSGSAEVLAKLAFKYRPITKKPAETKAATTTEEQVTQETTTGAEVMTTEKVSKIVENLQEKAEDIKSAEKYLDLKYSVMTSAKATLDDYQEILDNSYKYYEYKSWSSGRSDIPEGWERVPGKDLIRRPTAELLKAQKNYKGALADYNNAVKWYEKAKAKYEKLSGESTAAASTETVYEYKSWSSGLEVPEGWERSPGYEDVIRKLISEPSTVLSEAEKQKINESLDARREDIQSRINELNKVINEMMGRSAGDNAYFPGEGAVPQNGDIEDLKKLVDERYALLGQAHAISAYKAYTLDGNYVNEIDPDYLLYIDAISSPELIPYINENGVVDNVLGALKDNKVSNVILKNALGISNKEFAYLQEMKPYIKSDGSVDAVGAIKDKKVREDSIKFVLGIDQSQYSDLRTVASYSDSGGKVNISQMILDNLDKDTMKRLVGMTAEEYDTWQKVKPFMGADGSIDLLSAVNAGLDKPEDYPGWNISTADIQFIKDYSTLKSGGYIDDQGALRDIYVILKDQAATDALKNVLGLTDEELENYIKLLPYVQFDYEYKSWSSGRSDIPEGWERVPGKDLIRRLKVTGVDLMKASDELNYPYEYKSWSSGRSDIPDGWERVPDNPDVIRRSLFPGFDISQADLDYVKAYNRIKDAGLFNQDGLIDGDALYDAVVGNKVSDKDLKLIIEITDDEMKAMRDFAAKVKNISEKNLINTDGTLNLSAGVTAGLLKPEDYPGWNVTQQDIDDIVNYNKTIVWLDEIGAVDGESYDLQLAFDELLKIPAGEKDKELKEGLKAAFGDDVYDTEWRLWLTKQPVTMTSLGAAPPMSNAEYAQLIKPESISNDEYEKIVPYITVKGGVDYVGAINAGVPDQTIVKIMGFNAEELEEAKWQARFEANGYWGQLGMRISRDPAVLLDVAKELGLSAIPIYGTIRNWDEMGTAGKVLSIIGDVLIMIPVVKGVSAAVKSGSSISEAVLKGTALVARDTIMAPYTLLRHPIASIKGMVTPLENLIKEGRIPLAATWRGSYSEGMDITKVLAGATKEEALATRAAIEDIIRRVNSGEKSVTIDIKGVGTLQYEGSGLQKILPG